MVVFASDKLSWLCTPLSEHPGGFAIDLSGPFPPPLLPVGFSKPEDIPFGITGCMHSLTDIKTRHLVLVVSLVTLKADLITSFARAGLLTKSETRWSANSHYFCQCSSWACCCSSMTKRHQYNLNADWTEWNSAEFQVWNPHVVSIHVEVVVIIRNYTRQRLGALCEQNRSQPISLWYSKHKGDRSRHNVVTVTDWLRSRT